jgi:hypothetical protein
MSFHEAIGATQVNSRGHREDGEGYSRDGRYMRSDGGKGAPKIGPAGRAVEQFFLEHPFEEFKKYEICRELRISYAQLKGAIETISNKIHVIGEGDDGRVGYFPKDQSWRGQ